ncbi:MAG: EAL domain-containing protein [Gammaproteobacteria bacterium]
MHPILRQQLQAALGQASPQSARLEALVKSVHQQYHRYEKELSALQDKLGKGNADRANGSVNGSSGHNGHASTDSLTTSTTANGNGAAKAPADALSSWEQEGDEGLRILLDNIKDGIISVDGLGRIRSMNVTAERMFGRSSEELVGQSLGTLLVMPGATRESDYLRELSRVRENTQLDLSPSTGVGLRADGREFPLDLVASATAVSGREIFVLAVRDTTERHEAERALRESETRYRSLVDTAPDAIVVLDPVTGCFADANEKALRLFRVARDALLAGGPATFSPPQQSDGRDSKDAVQDMIHSAMNGAADCFEWLHQDSRGDIIPCEMRLAKIELGGRAMLRASIMDIRARKRAELQSAGERTILELIAANAPLPNVLVAAAETLTAIVPFVRPAFYVLDEGANALQLLAGPGLPESFRAAVEQIVFAELDQQSKLLSGLDATICMADIGTAPVWAAHRNLAIEHGFHGCWSAPIRDADGRLLGAFATYLAAENVTLTRQLDLFDRMIRLAGIAIARKRDERALRDSEQRYRGLFEKVLDGVYQVSANGRFIACNPSLVQMLGYDSEAEIMALSSAAELYADPEERQVLIEALHREGSLRNAELRLRRKDGREIFVLENARVIYDENGESIGHEGTLSDITERKLAELEVRAQRERAQVTLNSIADGVITTDNAGRIDYLNPVAQTLTGWPLDEARGRPVGEVIVLRHDVEGHVLPNPAEVCLRDGEVTEVGQHSVLVCRDGNEVPIQDSAAPIRDTAGNVSGVVLVVHDVSKERQLRRQLAHQTAHDSLTGLINRREFEVRLENALHTAREGASHVLLYIDLDQFKVVNDTCGHSAGDQLLKQVTSLLRGLVRSSDTVSRLGGDEFGVLLEHCGLEQAINIADDMRAAIREFRFVAKESAFEIGASIGLVAIGEDSESIESLMSAADVACYSAKDLGRNRVHVYQHGSAPDRHAEMQWVSRVTRAIDEDRLELHFQPIIPIGENADRRGHYELLVRMRDESGRMVPPNAFIPAAERYNMMPMLDRWVILQALEKLVFQPQNAVVEDGYTLAINLSGTSLNDDNFLQFVIAIIDQHKPAPGAICFEITETAAISNLARAAHFMNELKARGCEFSLDDFGNGLSSFSYLQNLPVDYIKIDGNFVRNITTNYVHQCMVDAIHRVGKAMGIRMIAEHVECRETLELLERIGIDYAQGFHIAVPAPVSRFARLVSRKGPPLLRLA